MAAKRVLLVEGKDDLHVFAHLFKYHSLEGQIEIRDNEGVEKVKGALKADAFETLLQDLDEELKANQEFLGIVVDADVDLKARWESLTNRLKDLGYTNIPDVPNVDGTVLSSEGLLPTFGIWIMPDNSLPGMLEDFLRLLIPAERELLWYRASQAVDGIPQEERLFSITPDHSTKAKVHTYLAWQEYPGKPFGLAVAFKYFESDTPQAEKFIAWIRKLFEIPNS